MWPAPALSISLRWDTKVQVSALKTIGHIEATTEITHVKGPGRDLNPEPLKEWESSSVFPHYLAPQ